jgi:hypothetical protein
MSTYQVEPDELRTSAGDVRTAASSARSADASDAIATLGGALPGSSTASVMPQFATAWDEGIDGWSRLVDGFADGLFARGAHAEILARVRELMPGAFFSPSAHAALAATHHALGDDSRAQAVDSIRSTGDGTREHPWSVLRVGDEYDVLRAAGRVSREQTLVEVDGRSLDRHVCDDGSEAWFDVSGLVRA